jgi:hypothetical protein
LPTKASMVGKSGRGSAADISISEEEFGWSVYRKSLATPKLSGKWCG